MTGPDSVLLGFGAIVLIGGLVSWRRAARAGWPWPWLAPFAVFVAAIIIALELGLFR